MALILPKAAQELILQRYGTTIEQLSERIADLGWSDDLHVKLQMDKDDLLAIAGTEEFAESYYRKLLARLSIPELTAIVTTLVDMAKGNSKSPFATLKAQELLFRQLGVLREKEQVSPSININVAGFLQAVTRHEA